MNRAESVPTVVYCAGVSWDAIQGTDRQLVQKLVDEIAVIWVDPPLSVLAAYRGGVLRRTVRAGRLTQLAPRLTRLTTLTQPFPTRRGLTGLTSRVMKWSIRFAVRSLNSEVVATVVSTPLQPIDVVDAGTKVYYATDDFVAGAELMGISAPLLRKAESSRLREADILAAVSPQILDNWARTEHTRVVLPNGCDLEAYAGVDDAPLPDDVDLPGPIAGVVGQLSNRIDISLLEAVADRGISLLLVGPVQDDFEPERFAALTARSHVTWVGRKDPAELPSYLRLMDVGLTPYADSEFNRSSFPLKTVEYLAAGRAVVSTRLPAVVWLDSPFVVAADPEGFAAATEQLIAQAPDRGEVRQFAAAHSWEARARQLLDVIGTDAAT